MSKNQLHWIASDLYILTVEGHSRVGSAVPPIIHFQQHLISVHCDDTLASENERTENGKSLIQQARDAPRHSPDDVMDESKWAAF